MSISMIDSVSPTSVSTPQPSPPAIAPRSRPSPPPIPSRRPPVELSYPPSFKHLPKIKVANNHDQSTHLDMLGDLFSILITTEHIETAYVRDAISAEVYTAQCNKLISQYKTLTSKITNIDIDAFCTEYGVLAKSAVIRLKTGIPATVQHGDVGATAGGDSQLNVFHTVQHFITAMDSLKLNMRAVDELTPNLTDLVDSLNKLTSVPNDSESKLKTRQWLITLSNMKAHQELTDEQARQMAFDLDQAYNALHKQIAQQQRT